MTSPFTLLFHRYQGAGPAKVLKEIIAAAKPTALFVFMTSFFASRDGLPAKHPPGAVGVPQKIQGDSGGSLTHSIVGCHLMKTDLTSPGPLGSVHGSISLVDQFPVTVAIAWV